MPVAIFALVIAVTLLSVFAIERGARQSATAALEARADSLAAAVERRINASTAYLRAGSALIASLDELTPARFRNFVSELRLDADYRGAEGIGWAPVVRPQKRADFGSRLEAEAPGRPSIYPDLSPGQPFSTPVFYIHPDTERNRRALGYDMYSEPIRREAMDEAVQSKRPTVSGKLVLLQEGRDPQPGFIVYMPVFEVAGDSRELSGFIYSPFNAGDFLDSVLQIEDAEKSEIRLYDASAEDENFLAGSEKLEKAGVETNRRLDIAGRDWVLQVRSAEGRGLSGLAMLTLIFGMLVASLLMLLVRMLTQQATEDEAALRFYSEQNSIRNSLTRELNHRVKNTLANVLSIMTLTKRRASDLDSYAESLEGRVRALSATHDLLTQSEWGTTPVADVVAAETAPYAKEGEGVVRQSGPATELAPNDALSLGLALHELATNAAKYGALSAPDGTVEVTWQQVKKDLIRLTWQEAGGPPVSQNRTRGFGQELIERIVAHELGKPIKLEFLPDGVRCEIIVPVRQPSDFKMRKKASANP